jgi:hypothetical protein
VTNQNPYFSFPNIFFTFFEIRRQEQLLDEEIRLMSASNMQLAVDQLTKLVEVCPVAVFSRLASIAFCVQKFW